MGIGKGIKIMAKEKIFVGINKDLGRNLIVSQTTPNRHSHPEYIYAIGPFKTKRGAMFMQKYGQQNPHCRCVSDAEKLSLKFD